MPTCPVDSYAVLRGTSYPNKENPPRIGEALRVEAGFLSILKHVQSLR